MHAHVHMTSQVAEHGGMIDCLQVLGSEGTEEAILQAKLVPCSSTGLYDAHTHTYLK